MLLKTTVRALTKTVLCVIVCAWPYYVNANSSLQFDLPLIVNQAFTGDISATITEEARADEVSRTVTLPFARLKTLISDHAVDDQMEQWFSSYADDFDGEVSLYDLRNLGLDIKFDQGLLEIHAKIQKLGVSSIALFGSRKPIPKNNYQQSTFASGLNVFVQNTYSHRAAGVTPEGFGDLSANFFGFTTIGGFEGWSLFYEADYLQGDDKPLARQDVVLLHDDFDRGLRYSIGDVRPTVSELQSSPELFGVSVERNYNEINPFRNLNPSGRSSFELERAALVAFEVNGVIVSERNLEPGNYSISDFPLTFGANNVRVYVDDGTSRREVANFSTFVDLDLLEQGLSNFGVTAGVRRETGTGRSRRYGDEPVILGFYERGISQNFTAGAQFEAASGHALIGSKAVYGSRVGVFGAEANVSKREGFNTSFNSVLRYEARRETKSNWFLRGDFQLRYQAEDFFDVNDVDPDTSTSEQVAFNASLTASRGTVNYSLGANINEIDDAITRAYSASLFKSFSKFTASLNYNYAKSDGEDSRSNFSVNISMPLGGSLKGSRLRSVYRSRDEEIETAWTNPSIEGLGPPSIERLSVSRDVNSESYEADFNHIGARYQFDAQHVTTNSRLEDGVNTSQTRLNASTALGFADGQFALGKPFTRGFVVVKSHKTLRGKKVFVKDSSGQTTLTTAKRLSTTLVPINNSYNEQAFKFDVDDLPLGYDLGGGELRVFPGNLAGYKFTLGSDASNTVLGKALWPDKSPLNLKSGKLHSDDGDEFTVFTNRTGRFVAEKVKFGKYRMVFTKGNVTYSANIELKDSKEPGLVQVGTVVLERQSNES